MTFANTLTFPWDMTIGLILSGSLCLSVAAGHWLRQRRRRTLLMRLGVIVTGICSTVFFLIVAYGSFIEPQLITVTRVSIPFPLHQTLKIAVISDLHTGPYKGAGYLKRVVRRINSEIPDIVIIAGDLVLSETVTSETLRALEPLKDLRSKLGVFAILGNHDHSIYRLLTPKQRRAPDNSDLVTDRLKSFGIHVLQNTQSDLQIGNETLRIAGIEDVFSGEADIIETLKDTKSEVPVILVSHNPDIIQDPLSHQAKLIVTGHTHGGQIRLPWYGPVARLPTHIGRTYDQGIFPLDSGAILAITRGIGESGPRARLFAPPEILMITTMSRE